jgi:hypothetical protein
VTLRLCSDLSAADWLAGSDLRWDKLVTFGPSGFAAYARSSRDAGPASATDRTANRTRDPAPFELLDALRSLLEAPVQRLQVDLEDEDAVEQVHKPREVPRAAAEERHRLILVGDQDPHSVYRPDVVLVRAAIRRLSSFRIALVCQVPVTVNGMVAAPAQLPADRTP